jgi:hypothetical protein
MAVTGGIGGHVSKGDMEGGGNKAAIPCVRTWGINSTADLKEAVCSASKGAKIRVAGNNDWNGNYTGYGAIPDVWPGDTIEFEGAIAGSEESGVGAYGDVMIGSIVINIDIENGEIINHVVNFASHGELTLGTVTVPADESVPDPATGSGMKVEVATDPFSSFNQINEVRTVALTFNKENQAYVSSGTAGQTKQVEGNLDAQLALTCYAKSSDGWATFPQPNTVYAVRVYTTDTLFWLIKFMRASELGGMDVDIEGNSIVGCSINLGLNAFEGGVEGVIVDPAEATRWPV